MRYPASEKLEIIHLVERASRSWLADIGRVLTFNQARRIAVDVAKLPEVVGSQMT